ncbi:MAG: right-handed parallel beta-helix repeat-containing protein [Candidatus Micrarchaeota archaeon]
MNKCRAQGALEYVLTLGAILLMVVLALVVVKGGTMGGTQENVRASGLNLGLLANPAYAAPLQVLASNFTGNASDYAECESTPEILECRPVHIINDAGVARRLTVGRYGSFSICFDDYLGPGKRFVCDIHNCCTPGSCVAYYWDGDSANNASVSIGVETACAGIGGGGGGGAPTVVLNEPNGSVTLGSNVVFNYTPSDDVGFKNATLYTSGSWEARASNSTPIANGVKNSINYTPNACGTFEWNVLACDTDDQCVWAAANYSFYTANPGVEYIASCPYVINCSGVYHLNSSLSCDASGHGITVNAHDVYIDCEGQQIAGPGTASGVDGIRSSLRTNVTVDNCVVKNYSNGAYFSGMTDLTIIRNTFKENSYGAFITSSDGSQVNYNNFTDNSWGLEVTDSDVNTISYNNASNNTQRGISFWRCDNNTITYNTASNNTQNGIYFADDDDNNEVSNNNATNNGLWGISISEGGDNNIANYNNVSYNTAGIGVGGDGSPYCSNNTFKNNTAQYCGNSGVSLNYANNSLVSDNVATNNTQRGIFVYYGYNNTVTNNNADYNLAGGVARGIEVAYGGNNTVSYNRANNAKLYGIYLSDTSNNTVVYNNASNAGYGISVYNGTNNTVSNNNASNNNQQGIRFERIGPGNRITDNYCSNNTNYGLWLTCSVGDVAFDNFVSGNTAEQNGFRAIYLGCENFTLSNNIFCNNLALLEVTVEALQISSANDQCGVNMCWQTGVFNICTPNQANVSSNCSAFCP